MVIPGKSKLSRVYSINPMNIYWGKYLMHLPPALKSMPKQSLKHNFIATDFEPKYNLFWTLSE